VSPCPLWIERPRRRSSHAWPTTQLPRLEDEAPCHRRGRLRLHLHRPPQQRLPAIAGSHLLRPPSCCARETAVPIFPRPCNRRAPMDPTGGMAGKRRGGAVGAAGERVFAAPPDRSAPESGFSRSFLSGAVFGDRLAGILASCAEWSR
jgi:hypothetical protein